MTRDPILEQLRSDNPQERKRGISAAAKSADKRYLKPLAQLYQADPDTTLRTLAKKAGAYIKKNQPTQATVPADADDDINALRSAAMANVGAADAADAANIPPPDSAPADASPSVEDLLGGTETNPETAATHYNAAFELHLKGHDAKAVRELGAAFKLNPDYAQDQTAVALAAALSGQPRRKAAAYIANPDNWPALIEKHGGIKTTADERQSIQQLVMWIAAAVGLVILVGLAIAFVNGPLFEAILEEFGQTLRDMFNPGGNGGSAELGALIGLVGISRLR